MTADDLEILKALAAKYGVKGVEAALKSLKPARTPSNTPAAVKARARRERELDLLSGPAATERDLLNQRV